MTTPPAVGKTLSVKVDQQTYDVLVGMTATGMTVSDAVRSALLIVGGTYRKVWNHTDVPYGVRPTIARYFVTPYDPAHEPERGSVQTTVPDAYRARTTPDHTGTTARATPRPTEAPTSYPPRPPRPTPVRPEGPWPTPQ